MDSLLLFINQHKGKNFEIICKKKFTKDYIVLYKMIFFFLIAYRKNFQEL